MKWKILGLVLVFLVGAIIYSLQPNTYPEFVISDNFEVDKIIKDGLSIGK